MYSPTLGRFLQTDPIGSKDDLNLYAYVGNDPTDKTDSTGLIGGTIANTCSRVGGSSCSGSYSGNGVNGNAQSTGKPGHAETSKNGANQITLASKGAEGVSTVAKNGANLAESDAKAVESAASKDTAKVLGKVAKQAGVLATLIKLPSLIHEKGVEGALFELAVSAGFEIGVDAAAPFSAGTAIAARTGCYMTDCTAKAADQIRGAVDTSVQDAATNVASEAYGMSHPFQFPPIQN
jgi:hypothetical protein